MKKIWALINTIVGRDDAQAPHPQPLDYDQLIFLDAEDLAATGLKEAYSRLLPSLTAYVPKPVSIEELIDNDVPTYAVRAGGIHYEIYPSDSSQGQDWANATYALFDIVNRQLAGKPYKFYAISGGNELGGMFLTADQYKAAIGSLKRKLDWPYIPMQEAPWYGQSH